ncbi:MAG: glycosyltransferase family 2 protein, partial [Bilophila sp.]
MSQPASDSDRPTITGLVLTYNGARILHTCLESLAFCDVILVVDSFSTDGTERIACEHGATFVQHPWSGALPQFDYALSLVHTDWIVSLDQDEVCSEQLREALLTAIPSASSSCCGYYVPRRSWYYDRFLKHSGWYPDRLLRVFRQGGVRFTQSGAHEHIDPTGATEQLSGDILHYPYAHFREHLDKINSYAQQGADDLAARGKSGGVCLGLLHGLGRFLRIYLL